MVVLTEGVTVTEIFNNLCKEENFEGFDEVEVAAAAERLRQIRDWEDEESRGSKNEQNEAEGNHVDMQSWCDSWN